MNASSFVHLPNGVKHVVIPRLQRDYAQGRPDAAAKRVRDEFLEALHEALVGPAVLLDFVYGTVEGGVLVPVDGQQRLTTLFLLHWYLGSRAREDLGKLTKFTYETRFAARDFCETLVAHRLEGTDKPSAWLWDQTWFIRGWKRDPTIESMRVMLDAIHARFAADDARVLWDRLADASQPAISFFVQPLTQFGLSDDLYVRMNARGKQLTTFEHFKAEFEALLEGVAPALRKEFANKVDNAWTDLLWAYRGENNIIDDEFMRYYRYVTDMVCYQRAIPLGTDDTDIAVAKRVYGRGGPEAAEDVRFLFEAFDAWRDGGLACFDEVFSVGPVRGRIALYEPVDLFKACCDNHRLTDGHKRRFSLSQQLLLYAVLVHRIAGTPDFPARMRMVRNLVYQSPDLRDEFMREHLADVRLIVETGKAAQALRFNKRQLTDEAQKLGTIIANPAAVDVIHRLEDHVLLRGCLLAFDMDQRLAERTNAFRLVFGETTYQLPAGTLGALLACGDYSQRKPNHRGFQFGGHRAEVWRDLLGQAVWDRSRDVLMRFLDRVAAGTGTVEARLQGIIDEFVAHCEANGERDWRYYFVKYPTMRRGERGVYVPNGQEMGFDVCMLDKERVSSWYRDPFLYAAWIASGVPGSAEKDGDKHATLWFTGYESVPRWMLLKDVGLEVSMNDDAFRFRAYGGPNATLAAVLSRHGGADGELPIPRTLQNDGWHETVDRVALCAAVIRDLTKILDPGPSGMVT